MKKIRLIAKSIVPPSTADKLLAAEAKLKGDGLFRYDKRRYSRSFSKNVRKSQEQHLAARMIFHAHSLEKGLSHDNVRLGFGKSALSKLAIAMRRYKKLGYDNSAKSYQNSLSVIKEYIDLHRDADFNIDYVDKLLGNIANDAQKSSSKLGGITAVSRSAKTKNSSKNFEDLFNSRYSVREYDDSPVDIVKIKEAIDISMKAPSICNRQSSRVQIITDPEKIKQSLKVQGGMTGYATPPVLLAITTDSRDYVAYTERNQVYTDGGLFAMSLLLALEYTGLAACSLNAMFSVERDKAMRKILKSPIHENYIMFIAVGNFKNKVNVPKSFRYSGEEITKTI